MANIVVNEKFDTYWTIDVEGQEKLAIATGIPNRVFGGADMSRLKSVPGLIWRGAKELEEWPVEGLAEVEGQIIFWGAPLDLKPIDSPLSQEELSGTLRLFEVLERESDAPAYSIDSFYRLPGGALFCFPLNLMEFIHARQAKELLMRREAFNHPDLKTGARLSHTMAILIFQNATGELPFTRAGGYEWIHEEMRNKKLPPLAGNGMIPAELATAVDAALTGESFPTLDEWHKLLDKAESFSGGMTEPFKAAMDRHEAAFVKRFNRRKNSVKITIAAALAVGLLWIGGASLRNYLAPPFTLDMEPREVVETYYQGISSLSTETIDGTTTKEAGKGISNQVATIFVLSRQKEAYGSGRTISPGEWEEIEYAPLPSGYDVFGVSNLVITELGDNRFEVSYLMWYPPQGDMDNPTAYVDPHEIYAMSDILTVVREKRDRAWIIGAVDSAQGRLVPSREVLPQPE